MNQRQRGGRVHQIDHDPRRVSDADAEAAPKSLQRLVWRRHRLPTVTVQADTAPGLEASTVVKALSSDIAAFKVETAGGL